jgi:hypothetical protein
VFGKELALVKDFLKKESMAIENSKLYRNSSEMGFP